MNYCSSDCGVLRQNSQSLRRSARIKPIISFVDIGHVECLLCTKRLSILRARQVYDPSADISVSFADLWFRQFERFSISTATQKSVGFVTGKYSNINISLDLLRLCVLSSTVKEVGDRQMRQALRTLTIWSFIWFTALASAFPAGAQETFCYVSHVLSPKIPIHPMGSLDHLVIKLMEYMVGK